MIRYVIAALCLSLTTLLAQSDAPVAVPPFKIIGNIYYVGTSDPTSFLITTPAGHILLDSTYEQTAPMVLENIKTLGFQPSDVKILLSGHSHNDHVGGHALIQRATGAKIYASAKDAINLESGGAKAFHQTGTYEAVKVDRKLADGETVQLGGVTLTAHLTPGHTEGNTAWTMTVEDGGKKYAVVFASSMSINPGVHMVNYAPWPDIAAVYAHSFETLEALPCDVFLGAHAGFFGLEAKRRRLIAGAKPNPFIDADGYQQFLARWKKSYRDQIQAERAGK